MVSVESSHALLLERPWVPVCVGGVQLLAKSCFGNTAYRLLLTDMECVWEEEMSAAAIQDRARDLNRRLRAPVSAFFAHLCAVARPCLTGQGDGGGESDRNEAEFTLSRSADGLTVRLKSELAGVPFYWEFHCTPASVAEVCSHLVRPLLAMSRLLQRQVGELAALLARKDAEIQDYKENGAVLSRGRLLTDVFEEQTYRENLLTQVLPQVCTTQDCLGFDAELQELYTAVNVHRASRKRRSPDDHVPGDRSPNSHSDPERQAPDNAPSSPALAGQELSDAPADRGSNSAGPEEEARSAEPEVPQSEQTVPLNPTPSDRSSSRARKKKKVGLFR
ncbi:non-homologous end-joining factor 1 [Megalops cyprinoides]|uniref:non-homologous end-joining factor 1 n=1 Tax=Megalops cyprinoides TaxID=118141 RepID=UPI0018642446|nr:non-homologous end-joining factor 1 [Megalops cyprinoides]